jgi:RNA polymerase sigma-70 factor (ECF subfamily)
MTDARDPADSTRRHPADAGTTDAREPAGAGATDVEAALAEAFRTDWGRVVATLIGALGDWDLAEESAQEAFAAALPAWRREGVPGNPRAWLTTTARNRAIDRLRRARVGEQKLRTMAPDTTADLDVDLDALETGIRDERLRLLYTCCHPALSLEAQVTLALRTLCGLTTAEIARTFLVAEATMAKRLVRTRQKIKLAGIPYRVPPAHLLPERTGGVLSTVYLLFHQGYADGRADLRRRARDLAALVAELMPDHPEAGGLHALLLLLDARAAARAPDGVLVPLDEQDKALWDRDMIAAGEKALRAAVRRERIGPYQIQAMIAACHVQDRIDWARVAGLYDRLLILLPSDTVRLNRAIALSKRDGPDLALLDGIGDHQLLPATRADFLRRLGDHEAAAAEYAKAAERAPTAADRRYLEAQGQRTSRSRP